jgi:hypothetical protein
MKLTRNRKRAVLILIYMRLARSQFRFTTEALDGDLFRLSRTLLRPLLGAAASMSRWHLTHLRLGADQRLIMVGQPNALLLER